MYLLTLKLTALTLIVILAAVAFIGIHDILLFWNLKAIIFMMLGVILVMRLSGYSLSAVLFELRAPTSAAVFSSMVEALKASVVWVTLIALVFGVAYVSLSLSEPMMIGPGLAFMMSVVLYGLVIHAAFLVPIQVAYGLISSQYFLREWLASLMLVVTVVSSMNVFTLLDQPEVLGVKLVAALVPGFVAVLGFNLLRMNSKKLLQPVSEFGVFSGISLSGVVFSIYLVFAALT